MNMLATLKEEDNETIVDESSLAEAAIASVVCETFPGIGADRIVAKAQASTRVVSGLVRPDYLFLARMGPHKRLFLRRENKSLLVMVSHAHDLDRSVDTRLENIENLGTRAIYTQAYTATRSADNCKLVVMGHPMLYRIGYARGTSLYVSGWRSAEPARIQAILSLYAPLTSKITQGRLVYETVALSRFTTDEMDLFLNLRHDLRINIPRVTDIVVGMVRVFAPSFISRFFLRESIMLEDETHYGKVVWADGKHHSLNFPHLFKPTFVWGNDETVAKVVDDEEYDIWKAIEGISGIPPVTGEIRITSHPNRDRRLLLTAHVGEPVSEAGLDPEDPANYPTLSVLFTLLS
ncbi:hypothetical protein B0H16DRAFT_601658 [Mycena metata]|uniref:Uncharacterized protein n=1 Tax=Mycena metata TaxID=1033252 RepID=A0AAD7NYR7_9AGAR|nr:hypothetical protein B0H16DRAFT_601658 [Mycena metata]